MNKKKFETPESHQWHISLSNRAINLLTQLTMTGLYGDSVMATAEILLLEKLREIEAKEK